ncbi:MAG: haloacid dehalogenase [Pirellulaceae bacterium]|nr:MAG: haloacid dehalogenase [Pirellulaceae bacterium]
MKSGIPQQIELILSDVDGVLTDGAIVYNNQGIETKSFHVRDGLAIQLWKRAGFRFGLITSRTSHIVKVRAAELGIDIVRQGSEDKLAKALEVMAECGVLPERVCFIGDDLPDIPVMRRVGFPVAVADAEKDVRDRAAYVTRSPGGRGAVREVVEMLLKAKSLWGDVIAQYLE